MYVGVKAEGPSLSDVCCPLAIVPLHSDVLGLAWGARVWVLWRPHHRTLHTVPTPAVSMLSLAEYAPVVVLSAGFPVAQKADPLERDPFQTAQVQRLSHASPR